jgi:lysophospholipase L1-like esterase
MRHWKIAAGAAAGIGISIAVLPRIPIVREIRKALSGSPAAWAEDMERFAREDRARAQEMIGQPDAGVIVFTGSSSITYWKTLAQDMAPLPVLNRGFGGSRIDDAVYWAHETVIPYRPQAVVLFAGTNDLVWPHPKTAQGILSGYLAFVNRVQAALPEIIIYYVSITPTPARWKQWPIAREANQRIQAYTETDARLRFIDLTHYILGPDGQSDRTLYRIDRLHPNRKGYTVWTSAIKPVLLADLRSEPPAQR